MRALSLLSAAALTLIPPVGGSVAAAPSHQAKGTVRLGATITSSCTIAPDFDLDEVKCNGISAISMQSFTSGGINYRLFRFAGGGILCIRQVSAVSWVLTPCPPLPTPSPTPTPRPTATPSPTPRPDADADAATDRNADAATDCDPDAATDCDPDAATDRDTEADAEADAEAGARIAHGSSSGYGSAPSRSMGSS